MKIFYTLLSCFLFVAAGAQEQYAVYFDFDKDTATVQSSESLKQWIVNHKQDEIIGVHGYADSVGTSTYNIKLSGRRAAYVAHRLKSAGFSVKDPEVKGFGETTVFSQNAANDRIVILHYRAKTDNPGKATVSPVEKVVAQATAPPVKELTAAVKNAKVGDRLRLPNMNFYNNVDVMMPESKPVLEELLGIMLANPGLKITIEGHICCNRLEANRLSIKRAKVIYNYLTSHGIEKNRLDYRGYAGTSPIYRMPEKNEEERAANRRVEIHIRAK